MSVGARLETALSLWDGGGVMAFVESMADTGVRGATYPAVSRYLANETEPTLSFISAASRVLGVNRCWLAFGDERVDGILLQRRRFLLLELAKVEKMLGKTADTLADSGGDHVFSGG